MTSPPRSRSVAVVMPVLDEKEALPRVIGDLPPGAFDRLIVVDNGSTDGSAEVARAAGAEVVREPRRGYGSACLAGIAAAGDADILVFLDADHSDDPRQVHRLVDPIARDEADLVIGSRVLGGPEPGALAPHARFGNWLATSLIRLRWGARFTDLGPFRAIRRESLERLGMRDRDYGWTVEMQVRAARAGLRAIEVPVDYRRRLGRSKISGTVRGTVAAGIKILGTIGRHALLPRALPERNGSRSALRGALISVVIPTVDEEEAVPRCLEALAREEGPLEILVVDGSRSDRTARAAAAIPGVRVLRSAPGRARQLATGAEAATGEILWLLHADCIAPAGAARAIRRALAAPGVALGAFRFALDESTPSLRLVERGARARTRLLRAPYGDQGLFLRRTDLAGAGGVPQVPILEDVELVRRLRRRGRLALIDLPLVTSARRYREDGVWRTTLRHQAILLLDGLGVPRRHLARLRRGRARAPQRGDLSSAGRTGSAP